MLAPLAVLLEKVAHFAVNLRYFLKNDLFLEAWADFSYFYARKSTDIDD